MAVHARASAARLVGRPHLTELRLSALAGHRRAAFPPRPPTLFAGRGGSGKTSALRARAYAALARLGGGDALREAFADPAAWMPDDARPDRQRRRGFRTGPTADGPEGPVRLHVAVQAEPRLRLVGERLTADGLGPAGTALRDPARPVVEAAWYAGGPSSVTRASLPDGRPGTALLPLRTVGRTRGPHPGAAPGARRRRTDGGRPVSDASWVAGARGVTVVHLNP